MKSFTTDEYKEAGCMEMHISTMLAVHVMTDGKVCDTGCHAFDEGNCQAYRNLIQNIQPYSEQIIETSETVKQEASRRSISISEVRRQRRSR